MLIDLARARKGRMLAGDLIKTAAGTGGPDNCLLSPV